MAFGSQAAVSEAVAALQKEQSAKPQAQGSLQRFWGGQAAVSEPQDKARSKATPEMGAEAVHWQALWKALTNGQGTQGCSEAAVQNRSARVERPERKSKLKAWNGFGHCRSGSRLHTQGGPGRCPALARARQGRRIFLLMCENKEVDCQPATSSHAF